MQKVFPKCAKEIGGLQVMRHSQWNPTRPMYWRGDCYGIVEESCLTPWEGCREEFGNPPEYEIRGCRECLRFYSKNWFRNSLDKFWMWNAWDIHHHHERDESWQMIRRSSGQRQEFLSTLILFYVLVRRNKVQEQQKSRKANLKTSRCIPHIKMQWESIKKQLNSRGKSQIFSIVHSSRDPGRLDTEERPTEGTESSSCPWSTTSCGNQMIGIASQRRECEGLRVAVPSRTLDVSWSRLRHDMGQWDLTENKMVQRFKETRHPIFSQASVLWIEEFSNEDKRKVPFTSIENPRTRNYCFQTMHSATQHRIHGAATNIGVLSSAWRLKRKDQLEFLWTVKCWLLWSQKKWNGSPHTQAPGDREQGHSSFRVLENRVQMTQLCEKASFQYLVSAGNTTRYNLMEKMNGEKSHLCCGYTMLRAFNESEVRLS